MDYEVEGVRHTRKHLGQRLWKKPVTYETRLLWTVVNRDIQTDTQK